MIRSILAALCLAAVSGMAWAGDAKPFNDKAVAELSYVAIQVCRMGEDRSGQSASADMQDFACKVRDELARELLEKGWCFDTSEQEWAKTCATDPQ